MYSAEYKTPFRCHTVEELLEYPLTSRTKEVDLFLYLIDAYDLVYANLEPPFTNVAPYAQLALKLRTFLLYHYDTLRDAIPGRLKFWSKGMFVYIVACGADQIALKGAPGVLVDHSTREFVSGATLRMHESWHTGNFTFSDVMRAYEAVHTMWKRCEWDPRMGSYLEALRARCSWLVTNMLPASIADVVTVRMNRQADTTPLHPHGIYDLMAYDMQLHRSQYLRAAWPVKEHAELPDNFWHLFYEKELRHLEVRKFRDKLGEMLNERMLLPRERDVCGYRGRSNEVSAYAALSENRPLFLLDTLAKTTQYGTVDKLIDDQRIADVLHVCQMGMNMQGLYNIPWIDYFVCFEEKIWKHLSKLATTTVPFIIERSGLYDVMWKNEIYTFGNRHAADAIVGWTLMLRRECNGVAYGGIDLQTFCATILDPPVIKEKSTTALTYQWK